MCLALTCARGLRSRSRSRRRLRSTAEEPTTMKDRLKRPPDQGGGLHFTKHFAVVFGGIKQGSGDRARARPSAPSSRTAPTCRSRRSTRSGSSSWCRRRYDTRPVLERPGRVDQPRPLAGRAEAAAVPPRPGVARRGASIYAERKTRVSARGCRMDADAQRHASAPASASNGSPRPTRGSISTTVTTSRCRRRAAAGPRHAPVVSRTRSS